MKHALQTGTIGIISLGCPRNLADSERILTRLKAKGFKLVDIKDADTAIINTCSFIKEAKEESIDMILDVIDLKKRGKIKKIIVAGCLPQRYKTELASHLKEVDAFVGRLSLENYLPKKYSLVPKHFSYVKISEGCRNKCTYCVIPSIKGKFVSRSIDSILKEIRFLETQGAKEINVIGQDITSYGSDCDNSAGLTDLLKKIIKTTKKISWIRLLYMHPSHITKDLIELIAKEKKMCKYIDLPLQHINDTILKRMNRKVTKVEVVKLITLVRKAIPGVVLRTSFIVGFPGETEAAFKELLNFMKEVKFERLGAFMYSREEDTPAYSFKNQIPEKIKKQRYEALMLCQQEIATEINRQFLKKELEILIDEKGQGGGVYLGRTQCDAPEVDGIVYVRSKKRLKPGDFVRGKIVDTHEYDLVAQKL
ncbi:30S ribosomal protein S12 methylthiotransferase RimO [Candidatus Omnitrophota bacterium]